MIDGEQFTGLARYRAKSRWFGSPMLVLQVEVVKSWADGPPDSNGMPSYLGGSCVLWRDATVDDLTTGLFKGLDR